MIAHPRVVKRWQMLLKRVGHAGSAYHGVFSVVGASTTMSMKKHFAWSGFVRIVLVTAQIGKMERMAFLRMPYSRIIVITSVFMARG